MTRWYAPAGEYLKDHTIIEREGRFHLLSISGRAGTSWYYTEGESVLSHSVSDNLRDWELVGYALPARGVVEGVTDGAVRHWREDKVWAPHCIEHDGAYVMFYTAVDHDHAARDEYDVESAPDVHAQRICVARSTDLVEWTADELPVFEETADGTVHPGMALRDPMVLRDEPRDRWVMYVTMLTEGMRNAVGAVVSTDLRSWQFAGFVYTEPDDADVITESPFVSEVDGTYYLFMNDGYAVSNDPLGPFGGLRRYLGEVPGWGAGENLVVGGRLLRSVIGGAPLIHENGLRIGGELAVFEVSITSDGVELVEWDGRLE